MPLLTGTTFVQPNDDAINLMAPGIKWDLSQTNKIVWGLSNDVGVAWPDLDLIVQQLGLAYDAIEQFINVDFEYGGVFDTPIAAAEAEVDLVTYPTLHDSADPYGASAVLPLGGSPDFPDYAGVQGDFKVMLRPGGSTPDDFALGSWGFSMLLHEIGHTLGLKHPHSGSPTISDVDLPNGLDNDWATFMSYKDEFASQSTKWNPVTPMVLDVLTLQYLYGFNTEHNAGDTEFTLVRYEDYYTYWDPSGDDVVDATEALEGWNVYLPYLQISTEQSTMSGLAVPVSQDTDSFDTFAPTDLVWLLGDIEDAIGSNFDDGLFGNALDNYIWGGDGNDYIRGNAGNDYIDGEGGTDTSYQDGAQTSYTLTLTPMGTTLTDRRADGSGVDTLTSIEYLVFGDSIDTEFPLYYQEGIAGLQAPDLESFIELYIAYFNRAPDAEGLGFWGTVFSNGFSLEEIAGFFIPSAEYAATYPEGQTNADFATAVYNNVLGRLPDQSGFDFWVGALDQGGVARDQFILQVLRGAKIDPQEGATQEFIDQQLEDRAYLETKVDIGAYFSVHKGMSDVSDASAAMALYDGSAASITAAVDAINGFYADALDADTGAFIVQVVGVLDDPFAMG